MIRTKIKPIWKEILEEISSLIDRLEIKEKKIIKESAYKLYQATMQYNFIRRRKKNQVVAVCCYIICRCENKSIMLNDFSDFLSVNIYDLGVVFIELCHELFSDKDSVFSLSFDPNLFVIRFVDHLRLGSKKIIIKKFCFRLIDSMKRNWIQIGRHPASILGAALYISSNMLDLSRSKNDIIHIVNVAERTLEKRIIEFNLTNTSLIINIESDSSDYLVDFKKISKRTDESRDPLAYSKIISMEQYFYKCKKYLYLTVSQHKINKIKRVITYINRICFKHTISSEIRSDINDIYLQKILVKNLEIKTTKDLSLSNYEKNVSKNVVVDVTDSIKFRKNGLKITFSKVNHGEKNEKNDLSDLEDTQIHELMQSVIDAELKYTVWKEMNRDFLVQNKTFKRIETIKNPKNVKKHYKEQYEIEEINTLNHSKTKVKNMICRKNVSSKINYGALKNLFVYELK